ncbi:MAG: PKD domain-containing protein [Crocinitomicaceae bacterium]|nr:PKD domain-containing protein [Crocinitomicaceae bacterium]
MAGRSLGIVLLLILLSCKKDPPAPLPTANFYVDNAECTSGCWVYYYDQSYSAVAWEWDFGNGITSTNQNDSVFYNNPGNYNVSLSVWNADNVEDQIVKIVTVF